LVCPDKLNEFSDISFGDCRVPRIYGKQKISEAHYGGNLGQSDIICRTDRGDALLQEAIGSGAISVQPTEWKEILKSTKASQKKLSLINMRLFSRIFRLPFPEYNVTYYPKSKSKRLILSLLHLPSLIATGAYLFFNGGASRRWFRRMLGICPTKVLLMINVLLEKITNYHLYRRSELAWIFQAICRTGDVVRAKANNYRLRKRYGTYSRRGISPNQVSIDARPAIVDSRRRFGDWEGDTVIGKGHRGALVTLVERKSLVHRHPGGPLQDG
jgi:hypothetical protein